MTESTSETQPKTGTPDSAITGRLQFTLAAGGILFALALAVVLLRLLRLSEFPPGIDAGEGANGLDALRVLQGEHKVFFADKLAGREGLAMYAIALAISVLGRTEVALRLPTALASACSVLVVFWLGRLFFGRDDDGIRATPWRGLTVGGTGAGLMAVSLSQTIMGRTAFRTSWMPLLLCLCLALLWQGWQKKSGGGSWWRIALAGVFAGLLPYTYIPARFVPFLLFFFGLSLLLSLRDVTKVVNGTTSQQAVFAATFGRLRAEMPNIAIFVGVAGAVAAPLLAHFALHPEDFMTRSGPLWLFNSSLGQGNPLRILFINVWEHLLAFGIRGDPIWRHNFDGRPLLNPAEAMFFWLGVAVAAWRWRRNSAYRLLLLWLCILLLPALLSRDIVPNTLRMIGAAPAVYLLIAVGIWEVFRFLEGRIRASTRSGFPVLQKGETWASLVGGVAVGTLVLVQGVITFRTYFTQWADAPEIYGAYDVGWTQLARTLNAQPFATDTVYLIPFGWGDSNNPIHYSFHYLYQNASPAHLISTKNPTLPKSIESNLASGQDLATVRVVDWDEDSVGGTRNIDERLLMVLGKYGRYLGSEEFVDFRIHSFGNMIEDRPWTLYNHLEPPEVHYDGGISLNGVAMGHGVEQESRQQLVNLAKGRTLWMVLQWQVAPSLELVYSTSIRLHNADGEGVYQRDLVLRNWDNEATDSWTAYEQVDMLYFLILPADLPRGDYELRLVVYDIETLKPTVELGVWKPETVLAQLRLE